MEAWKKIISFKGFHPDLDLCRGHIPGDPGVISWGQNEENLEKVRVAKVQVFSLGWISPWEVSLSGPFPNNNVNAGSCCYMQVVGSAIYMYFYFNCQQREPQQCWEVNSNVGKKIFQDPEGNYCLARQMFKYAKWLPMHPQPNKPLFTIPLIGPSKRFPVDLELVWRDLFPRGSFHLF